MYSTVPFVAHLFLKNLQCLSPFAFASRESRDGLPDSLMNKFDKVLQKICDAADQQHVESPTAYKVNCPVQSLDPNPE